ncbi:metallophosphoesterase family protein [Mesobacillus foraminis]|uniref:metallophosphoesterase family protein n=1 Tax=Mesobacillus foraminis TaxID=279826 RepID=UPI0039A1F249
MKIAFISDIHGNAVALDAVLENLKRNLVDKVYVLGDLCYRGPEPKRSLDLVRSLDTDVIKGNADEWVVRGVREGEVPDKVLELMNEERNWTVARLDQEDLDYLQSLPTELKFEHGGISIHAYHATPESLFEVVLPDAADSDLEAKLMQKEGSQLYVYAHIHKPYIRYINGKIIMNIGSVGLPFDGMAKASYGLVEIENGNIRTSIQRVCFNQEKVVELYQHETYPNAEMMSGVIRNGKL